MRKTLAIISHDTYIPDLTEFVASYLMPFVEIGSMTYFDPDGAESMTAEEVRGRVDTIESRIDSVVDNEGYWEDMTDAFETLVLEADEDDLVVFVEYEAAA